MKMTHTHSLIRSLCWLVATTGFFFLFFVAAHAAVITWDGGGADNNWSTCANWSSDTCPGGSDIATFDTTSTKNATIDSGFAGSVAGVDINSGYTGTITQSRSLTVGTSHYAQDDGTFTGSSDTIDFNGNFTLAGGTFTATTGTLFAGGGSWTHTVGGTFTHNSGTVKFDRGSTGTTLDFNTNDTFNNVTMDLAGQTLTISSGDTMTVAGTLTLTDGHTNTGTIDAQGGITHGSAWDGGNAILNITGTNTRTINLTGSGEVQATVTLDAANVTMNGPGSGTTTFDGTLEVKNGTYAGGAGNVTMVTSFTQSGGTVTQGSGTFTTPAYTHSGGTYTGGSGTLDVNGTFTISGGTFNAPTGTIQAGGNWTHTAGGDFVHNSGTVKFDKGSAGTTVDVSTSETFNHLTIAISGQTLTISSGDTLVTVGTLTLTDGNTNTGTIDAQGGISHASGWDGGNATLNITGNGTRTIDLAGSGQLQETVTLNATNVTMNGPTSGTTTFDAAFTVQNGTFAIGDGNVTVSSTFSQSGGTVSQGAGTFTVSSTYSHSGGTYTGGSGTLDVNGNFTISGGTFNAPTGTMQAGGANWTHTSGGTFNHNSGTMKFDRGNTGTTIDVSTSETFYNLTLSIGGQTLTVSSGDTVITTGTLTLTDGLVSTGTLEAQGNVTAGSGFDGGSSPLNFTGSATQTFDLTGGTGTINTDIAVNKSGGAVNLASALVVDASNQDLTIQEGTLDLSGNNLTVNGGSGKLIVETGGNLQLQGGESITANTNYPQLDSGSTVTYDGTSTYTLKDYTYHHLTLNGSGGTFNMGAGETIGGNLTITAGTLDTEGNNLSVTSTFSNSGTLQLSGGETTFSVTMDTDSGTVVYDGGSTYTSLKAGNTYYNLTFNNAAGTWKHASTLDVNNTLTITAGTLDSNGQTITLAGNFANSGTYTSGSNTVTLDGTNQTLSGAITFNHLTKTVAAARTLTFPASTTTTINGTATLQGASGNLLSLRSSTTDTQATINFVGSRSLRYLDVKDINNSNATTANCFTSCTNSNNNTRWDFLADIAFSASSSNGSESSTPATLTVSIPEAMGVNATVDYAVTGGTASGSGTDYTLASGTATITSESTSVNISITIANDSLDENDETIIVTLSNPGSSELGTTTAHTYTITDNDDPPTVAFSAATGSGAESSNASLTVSLSTASGKSITVDYATLNDTATSGSDYTAASGTLTFTAGDTSKTVPVTVTNDSTDENDETFTVSISNPTNSSLGATTTHTYTITDNDDAPTVSIDDVTVAETEGNVTATFTATLSAASGKSITVDYATANATATAGSDYTAVSATTLTFSAGDTTKTMAITVLGDALDEADETFTVSLANATNSSISDSSGTGTITDNDTSPAVTLSAGASAMAEDGSSVALTATLSAQAGRDVTVVLAYSGTATNVDDYTRSAATVIISAGQTTTTATLTSVSDSIDEVDETIIVDVSSVTNGTESGTQQSTVTVTDNDSYGITITQSGGATSVTEAGSTDTYTVALGSQPTADVTIAIAADSQSTTDLSTLTFTSANWSTVQTVTITASNDNVAEGNHSGTITHTATSSDSTYNSASQSLSISIVDNDAAGVSVTQSGGSTTLTEAGATDTYTIVLTSQPTATVTITVSPDAQSSVSPSTLAFTTSNWSTAQTVTATATNDDVAEGNHTTVLSHVASSSDSGYHAIAISSVTATVTDNDTAGVTLTQSDGSTAVATSGATDTYTLVLTSKPTASVSIAVNSDSKVEGDPATVTFTTANWNSAQTITVSVVEATVSASAGTLTHTLTSADATYAALSVETVTVTITDDAADDTLSAAAGSDLTMVAGKSVTLGGQAEGAGTLIYLWQILSGKGSLANADTLTPVYTAPETNTTATIQLSVQDDSGQSATDTVAITVIAQSNVSTETLERTLVAAQSQTGADTVVLYEARDAEEQTILQVGDEVSIELLHEGCEEYTTAMTTDLYMAIGCFEAENEQGCVFLSTSPATELNDTALADADEEFVTICGTLGGDQFGQFLTVADIDNDSRQEFIVGAPGAGNNGEAYFYSIDTNGEVALTTTIVGSVDFPIAAILTGDYLSDTSVADDLFFGPENPSLDSHLRYQPLIEEIEGMQRVFFLAGSETLAETITLSSTNIDVLFQNDEYPYQAATLGDLNTDGEIDLALADTHGTVYLYFGPLDAQDTFAVDDADVRVSGDDSSNSSFGVSLAADDVSGDGVHDLVVGYPDYSASASANKITSYRGSSSANGAVYVVFGGETWPTTLSTESASIIQIAGEAGERIGSDLLLVDRDSSGTAEIYSVTADEEVLSIDVAEAALRADPADIPTGTAFTGGSSIWGCSLSHDQLRL